MDKPLLIFDFDGTLCDSFPLFVEITNNLADEFGILKITPENQDKLRNQTTREALQTLGISLFQLPKIVARYRKEMRHQVGTLEPPSQLKETLKTLLAHATLGILTSNSEENVQIFIERHHLDCFSFIKTKGSFFGKGRVLKSLVSKHGYSKNKNRVYYIGDETRDVEAAKEAGVQSVAVAWGFSSSQALQKASPDFLFERPGDLVGIVKKG